MHKFLNIQSSSPFHIKRDEQGQNLVEFALVFGLIIIVFLGMIELTNLLQEKADLDTVVRQAARQAGEFGGGTDQVVAYVEHQLELMGYDTNTVAITVRAHVLENDGVIREKVPATDICSYGDFVSVRIRKNWDATFFAAAQSIITANPQGGSFNVVHTNRCWRAD